MSRLAKWSLFTIVLKSQNIESSGQLIKDIVKGPLKQSLESLDLSEDDERLLRAKKQEYKKISSILEMAKEILNIYYHGKWVNVFNQLVSIEKKLYECQVNTFAERKLIL